MEWGGWGGSGSRVGGVSGGVDGGEVGGWCGYEGWGGWWCRGWVVGWVMVCWMGVLVRGGVGIGAGGVCLVGGRVGGMLGEF